MVIKASGVAFDDLTPETGRRLRPLRPRSSTASSPRRSDAATHGYVYRHMPEVGGVAHTHSDVRDRVRRPGRADPVRADRDGADEFGGEIPIGPFAVIGDEEIGRGIVETLAGHRSPAVLMQNHGVFTHRRDRRAMRSRPR